MEINKTQSYIVEAFFRKFMEFPRALIFITAGGEQYFTTGEYVRKVEYLAEKEKIPDGGNTIWQKMLDKNRKPPELTFLDYLKNRKKENSSTG